MYGAEGPLKPGCKFVGVQVWAWTHVALGTSKNITGTVLAKTIARRTPRAMATGHGRAKEQG